MKYKTVFVFFMMAILLSGCGEKVMAADKTDEARMKAINKMVFGDGLPERCKGKQWKTPTENLDCQFPPPPIGRWKAVYTKDFAIAHNLPLENVSNDLSSGVDYMEMDVMPYGSGGTACLVNMLVKKPHDIGIFGKDGHQVNLPKDRKLVHLIDLEMYKNKLRPIASFESGSRDYTKETRGYKITTFALYAENVLSGYDYVSANANCTNISRHSQYFPDGYAFWIMKASVWGVHERKYRNLDDPGRPRGRDFDRSFFSINVPHELISAIFDGVSIGGK